MTVNENRSQSAGTRRNARWLFLPALGSALAHAPLLRFDLLPALKRPLDGGRKLRGRRVLGDNKTWRGALVMFSGAFAATQLLFRLERYRERLPPELRMASPVAVGAAVGAGVVLGELPNSFLKRQLGIAPGTQRRSPAGAAIALFDQADFVPVTAVLLAPVHRLSLAEVADAFVTVAAVHVPINVIGWAVGARESPL